MTRLRTFGLAAVGLASVVGAHAQTTEPTLFTAFKAYCIDTSAVPEAIKKAVEAAGGVVKNSALPGSRLTTWELGFGGENLEVASSDVRRPADTKEPDQDICWIVGSPTDDVFVEAIGDWVSVPPTVGSPLGGRLAAIIEYTFNYQEELGGTRLPLPSDSAAMDAAKAEGRVWRIFVIRGPLLTYVELRHFLPIVRR